MSRWFRLDLGEILLDAKRHLDSDSDSDSGDSTAEEIKDPKKARLTNSLPLGCTFVEFTHFFFALLVVPKLDGLKPSWELVSDKQLKITLECSPSGDFIKQVSDFADFPVVALTEYLPSRSTSFCVQTSLPLSLPAFKKADAGSYVLYKIPLMKATGISMM